jgi:plasmid maintenance system antidote protein VapI
MLSQSLRVSEELLTSLINQNRSITPSLARQLSVVCHTTLEYWPKLQRTYDRQIAKHKSARRDHGNGTHLDHSAAAA